MPDLKHTILIALLFSRTASAQSLSMKESEFQLTVGMVAVFLEKKDSVKQSDRAFEVITEAIGFRVGITPLHN